jgi:dihydropteroate synthase
MLTLDTLARLATEHASELSARVAEFDIGGEPFAFNSRPAIMGVVNLSADSWYRESVSLTTESAIERGTVLHAQGAQIIDVGAESTLAHAARADAVLQNSKLLPVVRELRKRKILV